MATIDVKTRGFGQATSAQEKLNQSAQRGLVVQKATAAQAHRSERERGRLLRTLETGTEGYNRKLAEGKRALAGHARETELVSRLEERLQQELQETSVEYREQQQQQKRLTDAGKARAAADATRHRQSLAQLQQISRQTETVHERRARRLKELDRLEKQVGRNREAIARRRKQIEDEYQRELDATQARLRNVDGASRGAFDTGAITRWGAAIAGPAAILTKTVNTLRRIRSEIDAAGDVLREGSPDAARLVQLAGADQAKADRLQTAANRTFSEGFVVSRRQARDLTFELEASGRLQDRKFFSRLAVVDDSASIAKSTGLIAAAFKGGDDLGASPEIVSKAFAAAGPVTGASPKDILEGVAIAAPGAKLFGFTDEELFAAVSRVAESSKEGASGAGTKVSSLFAELTRKGLADELKGQGINALLANIEKRGFNKAELVDFLGGKEAFGAFSVLRDRNAFSSRLGQINKAQTSDLSNRTINNALRLEGVAASVVSRAAEAKKVLSRDSQAADSLRSRAILDQSEAERRTRGDSEFSITLDRDADEAIRTVVGDSLQAGAQRRDAARRAFLGEEAKGLTNLEVVAAALDKQHALQQAQLSESQRQTKVAERQAKLLKKQKSGVPTK